MKKLIIILALLAGPALLQAQSADPNTADFQRNLQAVVDRTPPIVPVAKVEPLTKFNLDFKGGSPAELIKAIEKAMGKHLNVMIPSDSKPQRVFFPPLKLERVDAAQLFKAIGESSRRTGKQIIGTDRGPLGLTPQYTEYVLEYGFRPSSAAPLTDDTIWFFYNTERDPLPEAVIPPKKDTIGYFQMSRYLENTTIDAITTAINTSFELLNQKVPKMKFHPDTQLLIVAGTDEQIHNVGNLLTVMPREDKPHDYMLAPRRVPKAVPAPLPAPSPAPAPPAPAPVPTTPIEPANQ